MRVQFNIVSRGGGQGGSHRSVSDKKNKKNNLEGSRGRGSKETEKVKKKHSFVILITFQTNRYK